MNGMWEKKKIQKKGKNLQSEKNWREGDFSKKFRHNHHRHHNRKKKRKKRKRNIEWRGGKRERRGVGGVVVVGHAPGILLFRHRLIPLVLCVVVVYAQRRVEADGRASEKPRARKHSTPPGRHQTLLFNILIEKRQLFTPKWGKKINSILHENWKKLFFLSPLTIFPPFPHYSDRKIYRRIFFLLHYFSLCLSLFLPTRFYLPPTPPCL